MNEALKLAEYAQQLADEALKKHTPNALHSCSIELLGVVNQLRMALKCVQILGEQDAN